ncbi:hypothetical protein SDC9_145624 [bioreactor metagenome]|uniref:Uncharacterized protein n=1 Tax=bioreactor metagenome TaxID=1076179 RepID=A0A645EBD9_9ZZZZ
MDQTLHGTCSELRIKTGSSNTFHSFISIPQLNTILREHLAYGTQLYAYNLFNLILFQRSKHDDIVDTVQEFRTDSPFQHVHHQISGIIDDLFTVRRSDPLKILPDQVRPHIGGHDNNGILEVHHPTLVICQTSVIQHLQ